MPAISLSSGSPDSQYIFLRKERGHEAQGCERGVWTNWVDLYAPVTSRPMLSRGPAGRLPRSAQAPNTSSVRRGAPTLRGGQTAPAHIRSAAPTTSCPTRTTSAAAEAGQVIVLLPSSSDMKEPHPNAIAVRGLSVQVRHLRPPDDRLSCRSAGSPTRAPRGGGTATPSPIRARP
jgi:hypothetical protein